MILNQTAPSATADKSSADGSHWYEHTPAGIWMPLYTPEKNYTLREARKDSAAGRVVCPSVTTIFKVINKPQLIGWMKEGVAKTAYHTSREGKTEAEFVNEVVAIADNISRPAMDLGTAIHAAAELAIAGNGYDAAMHGYIVPLLLERAKLGIVSVSQEECCGSALLGYAGRCDEYAEDMTVTDIKSRKSRDGKVPTYSTDMAQLAAYGYAKWGADFFEKGRGIIWGVSTSEAGVVTPHVFRGPALNNAWIAFLSMKTLWRYENSWGDFAKPAKPVKEKKQKESSALEEAA